MGERGRLGVGEEGGEASSSVHSSSMELYCLPLVSTPPGTAGSAAAAFLPCRAGIARRVKKEAREERRGLQRGCDADRTRAGTAAADSRRVMMAPCRIRRVAGAAIALLLRRLTPGLSCEPLARLCSVPSVRGTAAATSTSSCTIAASSAHLAASRNGIDCALNALPLAAVWQLHCCLSTEQQHKQTCPPPTRPSVSKPRPPSPPPPPLPIHLHPLHSLPPPPPPPPPLPLPPKTPSAKSSSNSAPPTAIPPAPPCPSPSPPPPAT